MIDAHTLDPALHDLLLTQVPPGTDEPRDLESRLRGALRLALASRADALPSSLDVERALFVLAPMVETLAHGVALRRPPGLSLAAAKEEAMWAIRGYLGTGHRPGAVGGARQDPTRRVPSTARRGRRRV